MVTDLKKLIDSIERFSPSQLAFPGDYVGIQIGPRDIVTQGRTRIRKCAITRYASPQVIIKAASDGANVIIAYHGLFHFPVYALTDGLLDRIRLLIESKIALYVVHTSWLSAECGINDTLAEILGLTVAESFNVELERRTVSLGRVCTIDLGHWQSAVANDATISISDFIGVMSQRLATDEILYVSGSQHPVRRILLLSGDHGKGSLLKLAKSMDIDTFVTGNISSEIATLSSEIGMNYVCVSQDLVESIGMRRLLQLLSIDTPEVEFMFVESGLLWKKHAPARFQA